MTNIPGRLYRIANAYLNAAKDRLAEIDATAQTELEKSFGREDVIPDPPSAASSDPMARAAAKIAAAQQSISARQEIAPASSAPALDPVETAYKIIGIPAGSDLATVQEAVTKLRERCTPSRFPDGSDEQAQAQIILKRVDEAFQTLKTALGVPEGRFDKLEF